MTDRSQGPQADGAGENGGLLPGLARVHPFLEMISKQAHEANVLRLDLLKSELEQVGRVVVLAAGIAGVVLPWMASQEQNLDQSWLRRAAYALIATIAAGLVRQTWMRWRTDTEIEAEDQHAHALTSTLSRAVSGLDLDINTMGPIAKKHLASKAAAAERWRRETLIWDLVLYAALVAAALCLLWSLPPGARS